MFFLVKMAILIDWGIMRLSGQLATVTYIAP